MGFNFGRRTLISLSVVFILSLTACGGSSEESAEGNSSTAEFCEAFEILSANSSTSQRLDTPEETEAVLSENIRENLTNVRLLS